jgi:hypothetical protein
MRWKTHFPVADLARRANGRSAYVPETATPGRLRWHLAAYARGEGFAFSLVRAYVTWW